jgi:hypothetical protein
MAAPDDVNVATGIIVAGCALITMIGATAALFLRKSWHLVISFIDFLRAWNGEEESPDHPARPGVLRRLDLLEKSQAHVVAELSPNGGGSVKDKVDQLVKSMAGMTDNQDKMRARMELFEAQRGERENG